MNEDQNDVFGSAPQTPPQAPTPLDSPVPPMEAPQDATFPSSPLDSPVSPMQTQASQPVTAFSTAPLDSTAPTMSDPQETAFSAAPLSTPIPPMQAQTPQPVTSASQPAKGLAIAGIVLAFFPLQLIGLILSIIAKKKASKPSSANTLATVGIILNSISMVLIIALFGFVITMATFAGIQIKSKDVEAKTSADGVTKLVTDYVDTNHTLPTTTSDLKLATGTNLVSLTGQPTSPSDVEYAICNDGSVIRFGYWSYESQTPIYTYGAPKGTAVPSSADNCLAVTQ